MPQDLTGLRVEGGAVTSWVGGLTVNRQELLAAIMSTRSDGRLSSTEKLSLRQVVRESGLSATTLQAIRHEVFEMLEQEAPVHRDDLQWLERVVQVLDAPPPPKSSVKVAAWFGPEDPMVEQLEGFIDRVSQTLDIAVFTLTDDRLKSALIRAHRRGVRIRILTDNDKSRDMGSDVRSLLAAGLSVRMDRSRHHFHHKFAVFDDTYLVNGSYNWTRGADRSNRENFMRTGDPILVRAYGEAFEKMWKELD